MIRALSDSRQMFRIFLVWCLSWSAVWNNLILTSVESAPDQTLLPIFTEKQLHYTPRKAIVSDAFSCEDIFWPYLSDIVCLWGKALALFSQDHEQNLKREREKSYEIPQEWKFKRGTFNSWLLRNFNEPHVSSAQLFPPSLIILFQICPAKYKDEGEDIQNVEYFHLHIVHTLIHQGFNIKSIKEF